MSDPTADLREVPTEHLPMELARLHRSCRPGDRRRVLLPPTVELDRPSLEDLLAGAGFALDGRRRDAPSILTRLWTLPDTVGPAMRLLVVGLNPSPAAADAGVGFARPGNRFWPAAIAAGLVERDRDADHALRCCRVGMTDMVKRTTRRADEVSTDEFAGGLARLGRMVERLEPSSLCFVGLTGWRTVVDRRAAAGWQAEALGGAPVYLMPSTSGLNASTQLAGFVDHLRAVAAGPPGVS